MKKNFLGDFAEHMDNKLSNAGEGSLDLLPERVLRYLEYGGSSPSKLILKRLKQIKPEAHRLIQPKTLSRICRAEEAKLTKDVLPAPILGAEFLAFGLCTAGASIDEESKRLRKEGNLLDSMILDALGSAAVSELGEQLGQRAFGWASERNLNASRAFVPGSGATHWPLKHQRLIFANLRANQIGVQLTQHLLMQPRKTVSFVMGIGSKLEQAPSPFSCRGCARLDCAYRSEPDCRRDQTAAR